MWVADRNGGMIDPPSDPKERDRHPNPENPEAVDFYFVLEDTPEMPPKEQVDLQLSIDKVLRAVSRLYIKCPVPQEEKFRIYYARLFRIAQLGLEGTNAAPEIAKDVLASITADLVDDEAESIKNGHMKNLGKFVVAYSIPCLILYLVLCLTPPDALTSALAPLRIDPAILANFLILWVGCFIGVWLSYGIRTTTFSLADLTTRDQDRLMPHIRLIFAGTLSMIIGLLCAVNLIEIQIGMVSVTNISDSPMLAFIVGLFCGISELSLPSSIANRAHAVISSMK